VEENDVTQQILGADAINVNGIKIILQNKYYLRFLF
jgi:hypothetical protein